MMESETYYGFQISYKEKGRKHRESLCIGDICANRIEAGLALSNVLTEALATDYPAGSILECYFAPCPTDWPQSIWARIPLAAGTTNAQHLS